jgi:NIPSNAP
LGEARQGGRTEFVYLLEWPDEATMREAWSKSLADEEWIRIKAETAKMHGQLVGDVADRTLRMVDYSPSMLGEIEQNTGRR